MRVTPERWVLAIGLALALSIGGVAEAVTWNLTCSGGPVAGGCNDLSNPAGNQRSFTVAGQTLKARAFSTQNNAGTGTFVAAYLGIYGGGLGVTNFAEGDGSGGTHTVDNLGKKDLVVFELPTSTYVPTSVVLSAFGDTDFTAFIGGNALTFGSFTGLSYATLTTTGGFTQYTAANAQLDGNASSRTATLSTLSGRFLVISASHVDTTPEDSFKIASLSAAPPAAPVPEPTTLALLGTGLAASGLMLRRRVRARAASQ